MANDGAIIIKRIKKGGHGGHHGGAWKVAYADFVTAMMAFFLLMWLINTTTPEQKRGIADYFAAQSISQTVSGSGGVLGGTVLGQAASRAGGAATLTDRSPPTPPATPTHSKDDGRLNSSSSSAAAGQTSDQQVPSDDHLARMAPSSKDEQFASAAESIRQAMQEMPDIAALSRQVVMDQTPDGLRIQLVDQDGKPMFAPGSSEPLPYTKKLLTVIAGIIDRLPNRISISGHTDAQPGDSVNSVTNWQLSASRAEAARAVITSAGVANDRIYEVAGRAGSEPLLPEDPSASANRRLSILLMKEAPPIPSDHKL